MLPFAVKFADATEDFVEGLAMPFGGPLNGRDLEGEWFDGMTDFRLDFFRGARPSLFEHGFDATLRGEKVGEVVDHRLTEAGMWATVQMDRRARYAAEIRELVRRGVLSFSSGAYPPLVSIAKSGHIDVWPWVELSFTPIPANPLAAIRTKAIKADGTARLVFLADEAVSAAALTLEATPSGVVVRDRHRIIARIAPRPLRPRQS